MQADRHSTAARDKKRPRPRPAPASPRLLPVLLYGLLLCFPVLWPGQAVATAGPDSPVYLVLHSYANDYRWTNGIQEGIARESREMVPPPRLRVEYMDTKNIYNQAYLASLVALYRQKYAASQPDGIIVSDNNALTFIEEHGRELFPGVPVVACGINNAAPPPADSQVVSIIVEQVDHLETMRQARRIMPQAEKIVVIYDATPTGRNIAEEIRRLAASRQLPLPVEFVGGLDFESLGRFISARTEKELIYLLPYFRSSDGRVFPQGEAERLLAQLSPVPIFVSWAFQVGTGALGGSTLQPASFGRLALRSLAEILAGREVPRFQRSEAHQQSIYDYRVLKRFDIPSTRLPDDALILHRPVGFLEKHAPVIIPAAVVCAVLLCIITLLFMNLHKQKRLTLAKERMLALDNEIIDTQRELVATLGEVIEVRSRETGNHVKRVAAISRLLGEKWGLDEDEVTLLEAASPMHDVGKIGIPESILHKAGKLSESEFETIKEHTSIGKDILDKSRRELLNAARRIAFQHHERWDGSGYPRGLKGEEINIFARITTLADVYDALSSRRSYKQAWPEDKVLRYIRAERGRMFDPALVDLFLTHLDEIRAIHRAYSTETERTPQDEAATPSRTAKIDVVR